MESSIASAKSADCLFGCARGYAIAPFLSSEASAPICSQFCYFELSSIDASFKNKLKRWSSLQNSRFYAKLNLVQYSPA